MEPVEPVDMTVNEPKWFDGIAKGALALVAGALVTNLIESMYDKFVVERRNQPEVTLD